MREAICGLIRSSSSRHQPWQLAAALAMGVFGGLLPKLGFMFCLLAMGCALLPIHLPLALLACATTSLLAMASLPLIGRIGLWSLTHPWLSGFWLTLDAYPLIPWLGLHNTVVNGGALLGLGLWLPTFLAAQYIARRLLATAFSSPTSWTDPHFSQELKPLVAANLQQSRSQAVEPALVDADEASASGRVPSPDDVPAPARINAPDHAHAPYDDRAADLSASVAEIQPVEHDGVSDRCDQLQQLLQRCRNEDGSQLSVQHVIERAAQMAEFIDELLTSCAAEESLPTAVPTRTAAPLDISKDLTDNSCELAYSTSDFQDSSLMRPTPALPLVTNQTFTFRPQRSSGELQMGEGDLLKRHYQHAELPDVIPQPIDVASGPTVGAGRQHEALRYLLHHLRAVKDKV